MARKSVFGLLARPSASLDPGRTQKRWAKRSPGGMAEELMAAASRDRGKAITAAQYEDVPAPVRRYLAAVIPENRPRVRRVRFTQSGLFRTRGEGEHWQPFSAEQHVSTDPPGFVWEASIHMGPLLSVRVVDAYQDGSGVLRARLFGTVPVAEAAGPEMDEGEMMRYLAEAIWYPTALVPDERLSWRPVDECSALAVMNDGGREVAVKFSFDEEGMIFRIDADRFHAENGGYRKRPWTAYCGAYERRDGFRIPLEARVVWRYPQVELEYFQGRIQNIEYDP